jgi:transposase InsO family protein
VKKEVCHEEKAFFSRANCCCVKAGRTGHAGRRHPSASRHFGTDVLPLEETICGLQSDQVRELQQHQLAHGAKFRPLTIIDVLSKEALAIEVGQRLGGEHVVAALNHLAAQRKAPQYLFLDNGSEYSGRLLDLWAYHHQTRIDCSRPGKPTDNGHVESFNESFRDECLNLHWLAPLEEAKAIIEVWRLAIESQPHMNLLGQSPAEFAHAAGVVVRQHGLMKAEN